MGSIPDYNSMIEYIIEEQSGAKGVGSFQFRTAKSLNRFIAGMEESLLLFRDAKHKKLFYDGLKSTELSGKDKLMIVFWQLLYGNIMFREITGEVFMKAVYQGRSSLSVEDVYSFVRHLKNQHPEEIDWSDLTLKTIASKYLTAMKKFGLADGGTRKEICYPSIGNSLFVYFIRWCQCVCPENRTISNEFIKFGFFDTMTLISRLKKIDFMQYWDIAQIGEEITIDLKAYE